MHSRTIHELSRLMALVETGCIVSESTVVFWKWASTIQKWLRLQYGCRMNDVTVEWRHGIHSWSFEGAVRKAAGNACILNDGRIESLCWNGSQKSDAWCCQGAGNNGKQTQNDLEKVINIRIGLSFTWCKMKPAVCVPSFSFLWIKCKTRVSTWMDARTTIFFRRRY